MRPWLALPITLILVLGWLWGILYFANLFRYDLAAITGGLGAFVIALMCVIIWGGTG